MRALTAVARAVRLVGRSRRLTWAQAAWAAYITAEQGLEIALVVFAYGHGGIAAAGLLAAARSSASAVTAPFTAGLGDRFDRRLVLVCAALLTSAVVACMSLAVAIADGPWPVFVLALVAAVVIPVYRPVQAALLPRLSETPAQLTAANVIVSMLEGVGNLAGPALAGGLIVWAGAAPAFAALAALSFATGLAVSRVPSTPAAAVAAGSVTRPPAPGRFRDRRLQRRRARADGHLRPVDGRVGRVLPGAGGGGCGAEAGCRSRAALGCWPRRPASAPSWARSDRPGWSGGRVWCRPWRRG